jgi:hypothetical protein
MDAKAMPAPLTLTEAALVALLGLFAMGSARAADLVQNQREKEYRTAADRADARYRNALGACEPLDGSERDLCFGDAKATFIRAMAEAKARLAGANAAARAERSLVAAQEFAKVRCELAASEWKGLCLGGMPKGADGATGATRGSRRNP